ncbi:sigma-E processing peptidase SpoIIGA [Faecalibacterium prausnitzii]|uniref:sigma-E processing peptidase SpoIIGA n=1 Tax=Faecalibacterium prausnitzii TaxID=853 RepID=UPI0012DBEC51|nr:sigma-E processing peptidase SpoIIGA [Faecalibacterium prausnitzii]
MLRPACGVVLRGESAAGGGAAPARGPDQQRLHLPALSPGHCWQARRVVLAVQVLRFLGRGGGQVFPARLTVADTALDVRAFCDTGFSVQEPLSGRTVVLVRFGAVQSRLPPALGTYLEQHFAGAAPLPVPALGVRLVPCTTVAGHCILPAVPASLCCTGSPAGQGRAEHLYAAFADLPPPPDGWEVLVGVEAWEMIHPLRHRQA